jgi:hypothetical protein
MTTPYYQQYDAISLPTGTWIKPGGRVAAYVRSTGLQEGDDLFAMSGNLVATINAGLARCRPGQNDIVYVLPGHVESITGADGWSSLVAGTQIISAGVPGASTNPTVTFSTSTAAQILVDVANVTISGLTFNMAALDNVVNPILVTAAGFSFCGNHVQFQSAAASAQPVDGIILGAGASNCRINGNKFLSDDAGEANAGSVILIGVSAALGLVDVEVSGNYITGAITEAATDALIMVATTGSAIRIKDNDLFVLGTTGDCAVRAANVVASGVIARNKIRLTEDVAANNNGVIVGGGAWLLYENAVAGTNASAIVPTPAVDT